MRQRIEACLESLGGFETRHLEVSQRIAELELGGDEELEAAARELDELRLGLKEKDAEVASTKEELVSHQVLLGSLRDQIAAASPACST